MDAVEFAEQLAAVANPIRLRILSELNTESVHVSELARRIEISRPLLYMHLSKLEAAGFVRGQLELGPDGRAIKVYSTTPFQLDVSPLTISALTFP